MQMNATCPELEKVLPTTDTRLRSDIRLMEEGKFDQADKKKDELLRQSQNTKNKEPQYFSKGTDGVYKLKLDNEIPKYWQKRLERIENSSF